MRVEEIPVLGVFVAYVLLIAAGLVLYITVGILG